MPQEQDAFHGLRVGDEVQCPGDRGSDPYVGSVVSIGENICENLQGTRYVWVTVQQKGNKQKSVWATSRLTRLTMRPM